MTTIAVKKLRISKKRGDKKEGKKKKTEGGTKFENRDIKEINGVCEWMRRVTEKYRFMKSRQLLSLRFSYLGSCVGEREWESAREKEMGDERVPD